jgi:dipeptidyl aminopeptidase/acylaminoacyl peptidase
VAWTSYPAGTLWRTRADGTERLRLTGSGWRVNLPRWSPDGRSLVFQANAPGEEGLYVVSRDGGKPELLVRNEMDDDSPWDPCWTADGSAIFFSYTQRAHAGIYRVDQTTRETSLLPGTEHLTFPKCSVHGDLLALERPEPGSGGTEVYRLLRADRGEWKSVPHFGGGEFPNWSPDGESIMSLDPDAKRLMRWWRKTGELQVFTGIGELRLLRTYAVPWTGFAHDGAPLIVRDLSTRDLYALEWEAP